MKIKDQREYTNYSLDEYIPYIDILNDNFVFLEDLSSTIVLKINQAYPTILTEEDLNQIKNRLNVFLNGLNEDYKYQFIFKKSRNFYDVINEYRNNNKIDGLIKDIYENRLNKMINEINHNALFRYELFFTVNVKMDFEEKNIKKLFNNEGVDLDTKLEESINKLKEIENYLMSELNSVRGINIEKPSEFETAQLLYRQINLRTDGFYNFEGQADLINSDIEINKDYLKVGNKFAKTITIKNNREPDITFPTIINHLISANNNFEYDIITNIVKLNKESEKNQLEKKENFLMWSKMRPFASKVDKEKEKAESDVSNLLMELTSDNENLFRLEFIIIVKSDNLENLNSYCDDIMSSLGNMNALGYKESFANFTLYTSSYPSNFDLNNQRDFKCRTSYLADLLPVFGSPELKNKDDDIAILLRNRYNSLSNFDLLSERTNSNNALVVGTTGSGKSFNMQLMLENYLAENPIITIVELGSSYKKFVENLDGSYFKIEFDENNEPNFSINPFSLDISNKELFWRNIIEIMIKEKGENIKTDEIILIENAIDEILNKGIEKPIISDFIEVLEEIETEDLKNQKRKMIRHLNRWTKGIYGKLLNNKKSNLNVEKDIVGMDLKGLEDYEKIFEVFMFYLSSICWHKAEKNKNRKKMFIFDEVWKIFRTEQGGELGEEMYRTLRKYGASIISISQSISDFMQGENSTGIMSNVATFCLLEQADTADYGLLKETLNLTDLDIENIQELKTVKGEYADMFIKQEDKKIFTRLISSPLEYWINTSRAKDNFEYDKKLEKFNDKRKTLNYLAEKYPKGVF